MPTLKSILLSPLAGIYRLGIGIRNQLYHTGVFSQTTFTLPIISIGNLSVGGTGKTPHVEYLLQHIQGKYHVAMLSRGYGRSTSGFRWVTQADSANTVGDEPRQVASKFTRVKVAVGEQRALAIPYMLADEPQLEVIVLDDAFQHLAVKPGLNILLTRYDNPYWHDQLLPVGWLREPQKAAARADIIIVTKCPPEMAITEQEKLMQQLQPETHQTVYFSTLAYGDPYPLWATPSQTFTHAVAVAGIAYPAPFFEAAHTYFAPVIEPLSFPDHHRFNAKDVQRICSVFGNLAGRQKACLVTEKDAARLQPFQPYFERAGVPVWVLPVTVEFLSSGMAFQQQVRSFIDHFEA